MVVVNDADFAVMDACTLSRYLKSVADVSPTGARNRYRLSTNDFRYRKPAPETDPSVVSCRRRPEGVMRVRQ